MLTALYNSQDRVMHITFGPTRIRDHGGVGWNKTTGYKTKRGHAGCSREETMYEVQWSPSIILESHINLYLNNLDYKPKTITPLTDLDDMSLADHQIVTNLINIMGLGVTSSSLRKVTWESRSDPCPTSIGNHHGKIYSNPTHTEGLPRKPRQLVLARYLHH